MFGAGCVGWQYDNVMILIIEPTDIFLDESDTQSIGAGIARCWNWTLKYETAACWD
jgi:hypothetical protein